ncbi:MAG: DNA replication/repair protein RecF [Deferribacterales bacterium]
MYTRRVRLVNFRNHSDSVYDFQKYNYIQGDNGSGKTSVLEALYVLFNLKSFRPQSVNRAISFNMPFCEISAKCDDEGHEKTLKYRYDTKADLRDENGKISNKTSYLLNHPVICYSPEFRQVVSDDQTDRRKFVDRIAFQLDISHFDRLTEIKHLNSMKAAELRKEHPDITYLDALNEKTVSVSKKVTGARQCAVGQINELLRGFYSLLKDNDGFLLDLRTNTFRTEILAKEIADRRVVYGASRDKLYCLSEGRIYDRFSSFGQKKTFVLLTLAAGLKVLEQNGRNGIITFLDDFEAGLDENRIRKVFEMFSSSSQIFVTGVKNHYFSDLHSIRIQVKNDEYSQ